MQLYGVCHCLPIYSQNFQPANFLDMYNLLFQFLVFVKSKMKTIKFKHEEK